MQSSIRAFIRVCARLDHQPRCHYGNLSKSGERKLAIDTLEKRLPDDKDGYDKEEISLEPRKNIFYYNQEIFKQVHRGASGLHDALRLFERMRSVDRLQPTHGIYTVLLRGCARQGYIDRAFQIYKHYLLNHSHPTQAQITSLINVCGLTPYKEDGLKRLEWFLDHVKNVHNKKLDEVNYLCLIKTYGLLGRLDKVSDVVQEMLKNDLKLNTPVFNHLIFACVKDVEYGLAHAIRLFKRLKFLGLRPDLETYAGMLSVIRYCQLGSRELIQETLGELPALSSLSERIKFERFKRPNDRRTNFVSLPLKQELGDIIKVALSRPKQDSNHQQTGLISTKSDEPEALIPSNVGSYLASRPDLPNLLSDKNLELFYRIKEINPTMKKHQRFRLFGGIYGFLAAMVGDGLKPDMRTFTLISRCLVEESEFLELYRMTSQYKVKRDQLFYDILIHELGSKMFIKTRQDMALRLMKYLQEDGLKPTISTFEALALTCDTKEMAQRFLEDMKKCDIRVSDVMVRYLFDCALFNSDVKYLRWLVRYAEHEQFSPTQRFVDLLELKRVQIKDNIRKVEKGLPLNLDETSEIDSEFIKNFEIFSRDLGRWLSKVNIKTEDHPWAQFEGSTSYQSRRKGFSEYTEKFKKIEEVKQEALEKGENFGNLTAKAERRMKYGV